MQVCCDYCIKGLLVHDHTHRHQIYKHHIDINNSYLDWELQSQSTFQIDCIDGWHLQSANLVEYAIPEDHTMTLRIALFHVIR